MFARDFRLTKSQDIQQVLKKGRYRHVGALFLIKWLPNNKENHRIAIVVSSKVSKKAVDRNRIKRTLTNGVSPELLRGTRNYDIVVVAKKEILDSLPQSHTLFVECLTNINLGRPHAQ